MLVFLLAALYWHPINLEHATYGEHVPCVLCVHYTHGESKQLAQFEINIEINLVTVTAQIRLWLATTVYAIIEEHCTIAIFIEINLQAHWTTLDRVTLLSLPLPRKGLGRTR